MLTDGQFSADGPETNLRADGTFSLGDLPASLGLQEWLLIAFFAFYLLLAGVVLWGLLGRGRTEEQQKLIGRHVLQWQRLTFLAVVANLLRIIWQAGGFDDISVVRGLPEDPAGLAWLVLLVLSALGLFFLNHGKLFDGIWLLASIAAVTQLGHGDMSLSLLVSSLLSGIHLFASALWIGGLYTLLAMRNRFRYDAERLLPNVLNASIASMVLLFVSGLANSALYLPDLGLLDETRWGWTLLVKTVLFALVALLTFLVRRRNAYRAVHLLRINFLIVFLSCAISAVMPISEPVPRGEPVHWHVMGEDVHMTAEIDPMHRGDNDYRVTVWFPEGSGEPRSVEMTFRLGGSNPQEKHVVLSRTQSETGMHFAGFAEYVYEAGGRHIDRPGTWAIAVNITGHDGTTHLFEHTATVY